MKSFKYFVIALMISPIFIACGDDEPDTSSKENSENQKENQAGNQVESSNYYVMYEIEKVQTGDNRVIETIITYVSEKGEQNLTLKNVRTWTGTYGPLKNGDNVYLLIDGTDPFQRRARIYVSKNKEPFVIKAESYFVYDASLLYTIDF